MADDTRKKPGAPALASRATGAPPPVASAPALFSKAGDASSPATSAPALISTAPVSVAAASKEEPKTTGGAARPTISLPIPVDPTIFDPETIAPRIKDGRFEFAALEPSKPLVLNTQLFMANARVTASQPLEIGECVQGVLSVVIWILTGVLTISSTLQGSNDGENWTTISNTDHTTPGYKQIYYNNVAFRLIRVRYSASGGPLGRSFIAATLSGAMR